LTFPQKMNWGKIIEEVPDAIEILQTGDLSWLNPMQNSQRYDFLDNFMHSDLSYDLDYVITNDFDQKDSSKLHKNSKAIKAIKIMQLGL